MFLKLYAIALPIFLAIDMVWLGLISKGFYAKQIGSLMKSNINYVAGFLFYLLFIGTLVLFVIGPAIEQKSWMKAVMLGMLFGLVTYATYDLTNLATLKDWPVLVTVVDIIWGMTLTGLVSLITFFIANKFGIK